MGYPKVSVITPTLNQAKFIEETILSIKNQDYPCIEHVIIDGGSTDGTHEILKKYPHLIWQTIPGSGQSEAFNKGYLIATGEIIGWINSDDAYLTGTIKTAVNCFVQQPTVDMVYGDVDFVNEKGNLIYRRREMGMDYRILLYTYCYISHNSAFMRRRVLEHTGLLDEHFYHCMDYDLVLRIAKSFRIRYIPVVMSIRRLHKECKTCRDQKGVRREMEEVKVRYRRRFFAHEGLDRACHTLLGLIYRIKRILIKMFSGKYGELSYLKFLVRYSLNQESCT